MVFYSGRGRERRLELKLAWQFLIQITLVTVLKVNIEEKLLENRVKVLGASIFLLN